MAGYAGDLSPQESWRLLSEDASAVLIDVRTQPEWAFVGLPELGSLGKSVLPLSWQVFPAMTVNPDFVGALRAAGLTENQPLLFLCRSGVRSAQAAMAATATGFSQAFNVAEGFEGEVDGAGHRGTVDGWKVAGLPWRQS
ncbi:MAG: rhodanese-like domain-containing protein [Pseudomonadota bacterium]|nr:rhodanese-like domain-containing protein [Pseudomonadota bacterium]MEC8054844.1 rhodanese-like domain-containing protein [Pseudomonadota bacterium]MEC8116180.1 rhodanese-like domain-containing protein [Pseudomonadota bacterium]